ncbi:hypothetical protein Tco_0621505 [Tanacetum coccineum]
MAKQLEEIHNFKQEVMKHCTKIGRVGCEKYGGAHLNKDYPIHEKRSKASRKSSMESSDDPSQIITRTVLDIIAELEEWMKKLQESTKLNTRNQNASLKNLETQIEQLEKDYQAKAANEVPVLSVF